MRPYRGTVALALVIAVTLASIAGAEQTSMTNTAAATNGVEEPEEDEHESPARRFEVVWFISFPFVFAYSFMAMKGLQLYGGKDRSDDLQTSHWLYILTNAVGIPTYIATMDYFNTRPVEEEERKEEPASAALYVPLAVLRF